MASPALSPDRVDDEPVAVISLNRIGLLLLGSGLAALVYQTTWLREFRLVFGVSTAASAAVLAIFMGGLGIGGLVLGRRADSHPNPLRFYANLEVIVSLLAALTPLLSELIRVLYIWMGGVETLGLLGANLIRLILSALVLGAPTFFMGGTLPAAVRAAEREMDLNRRRMARVYGMNTIGAVCGVSLATFFLLEMYGNRRTLWIGVLVNLLVAMTARSWSRSVEPRTEPVDLPARTTEDESRESSPRAFILTAAFVSGFAFFLMEIVWYRMLAPLLGGSTFTFGLILAVALLGIGIGGFIYSLSDRQGRVTMADFGLTAALEALFLLLPFALGDRIAFVALLLNPLGALGFAGSIIHWTLITMVVVFLPALIAGYQFPLLVALMGRGKRQVGRDVGLTYLANTVGAIAGSLAGGFGLLPLLGAPSTWRFTGHLLIIVGILALLVRQPARAWKKPALVVAIIAIALSLSTGPTAAWRHSGIGANRAGNFQHTKVGLQYWANGYRRAVVFEKDGVESAIAASTANGISLLINGKSDGNAKADAGTQIMGGLLGVYLHPDPKNVLIIGLGTGSSAGWAAMAPEIDRVDVVELEPAVVEVAKACEAVNADALSQPDLDLHFGDAREYVLTSQRTYDVVFSEPSNPYRAGIAGLFTREFYASVESRLAPGGIFLQWVQGYEVSPTTVASVYATLETVFPHVQTWASLPQDLLLVASKEPLDLDIDRLRAKLESAPFDQGFRFAWGAADIEAVFSRLVSTRPLSRELGGDEVEINTDDRTPIEFGMARTVGTTHTVFPYRIANLALEFGALDFRSMGLDPAIVSRRRLSAQSYHGIPPTVVGSPDVDMHNVHTAYLAGDATGVLAHWPDDRDPADLMETLILGWAHAALGDEQAETYIGMLQSSRPVEAEFLRAFVSRGRGQERAAARHLRKALVATRTYPWVQDTLLTRALALAEEISSATSDRDVVETVLQGLEKSYSVFMYEDARRRARFRVASHESLPPCNEHLMEALEEFEPHPQWEEGFLSKRVDCYEATGSPLRTIAIRDMREYIEDVSP